MVVNPTSPVLDDKIALITGAASGIGRIAAHLFAAHGARLILTDVADSAGEEVAAEIRSHGADATFLLCDLADLGQVEKLAAKCSDLAPRLDVLFNNAAIVARDDVLDYDVDTWERVMRVNATAPMHLTRHLVELLGAAEHASVVNHSSIDGVYGNPFATSYSVAKAALNAITRMTAHTLAPQGIRVNAVSSGGATRSTTGATSLMSATLRADPAWAERAENLAKRTPGGRVGAMEEVADVALFLASDASRHVNGTSIMVDGGRSALTPGTV